MGCVYWAAGVEIDIAEKTHILLFFLSLLLGIWVSWLLDDLLFLLLFSCYAGWLSNLRDILSKGGLTCCDGFSGGSELLCQKCADERFSNETVRNDDSVDNVIDSRWVIWIALSSEGYI